MGRAREEKRREEERRKKIKEDPRRERVRGKGRKVAIHCVFPMICGSGGSKSRLAKAAGAEPSCQMRDEKVHALVGAKRISKSKVLKLEGVGALLEVEMFKKRTPLWHEAHFDCASYGRAIFGR